MENHARHDGRAPDALRPVTIETDFVRTATGYSRWRRHVVVSGCIGLIPSAVEYMENVGSAARSAIID